MTLEDYRVNEKSKGDTVLIESGLPFVESIATVETLRDDVTDGSYKVGFPDARGNIIALGQPFCYVDVYAPKRFEAGQRAYPFNYKVYRLEDDETFAPDKIEMVDGVPKAVPDPDHPLWHKRWIKHGEFETPDEARAFAATL